MVHFQDSILEFYTIIPFLACSLDIWSPLCLNFILFWPWGGCSAYSLINLPNLSIIFPNFPHSVSNTAQTTTSFNCKPPWCVCTHPINFMGIHVLCCTHGNECMGTHDVVHDTFAVIARDVGFYMGWEQLHAKPSTTLNSFHQQVDIVFTKNGIRTLVDIVIADPMHVDLFPQSCTTQGFATSDAAQAKKRSYYNWHLIDQFFFLAIEIFGCLHKQTNVILHNCANATRSLKRLGGLPLFVLINFLCQKF
jgi:hypothetical protein